jgi:hypothetical protein
LRAGMIILPAHLGSFQGHQCFAPDARSLHSSWQQSLAGAPLAMLQSRRWRMER